MLANALRRFGFGQLAHNTVLGSIWQFARIGGQALWVVAIARVLGPSGYGTLAGIGGLAATVGGLTGIGTGYLLLQNVSRDNNAFASHWSKAVVTALLSGIVVVTVFTCITHHIVQEAATGRTIAAIGVSEALCYPMVYIASFAFQAHERMGWSGMLTSTMSSLRLLAVAAFWFFSTTHDLKSYIWFHLAASALCMLGALLMVQLILKPNRARFSLRFAELREGVSFSAAWFTGNAVTELDKTLALRLAGSEIAGIYSAAYRMVSVATLPVASLALAAQPRLFRQSINTQRDKTHLVRNLALLAAGYGVAASAALLLLAGVIPTLLGQAFAPAVREVRLLILLPPLFSLRLIGNAVLMTSSRQLTRILVEIPAILVLIGLATLWIPQYGLTGIAMTVTTTEGLLAAAIWTVVWNQRRRKATDIFTNT
jgi:O-antigen/teichoic acid export membrane protein